MKKFFKTVGKFIWGTVKVLIILVLLGVLVAGIWFYHEYAKPILTIEGTGNIGVVLNGIQILEIDLSNNGKITIDVPKLEAYDPDDDTLLNRLVTGDYMKLLINEGDNKITFTGEVSGATLTNYIRWI